MDASRRWVIAAAIGSAVTAVLVGVLIGLFWKTTQDGQAKQAELRAILTEVRDLLHTSANSTWVPSNQVANNCYTNNSDVMCTVTNLRDEAVTTCLKGKLSQKKASGVTMSSLVICTGRLGPRETRTTSAPWVGGFAKDICNSTDRWGNEVLDWEACDFTTEPVDVPAMQAASK